MINPAPLSIFLSYVRADGQATVDTIRLHYSGHGLVCEPTAPAWLDLNAVRDGDWQKRLGAAISAADHLLMVVSPLALESKACAWELEFARSKGITICPVVVDRLIKPADLPEWLSVERLYQRELEPGAPDPAGQPERLRLIASLRCDLPAIVEPQAIASIGDEGRAERPGQPIGKRILAVDGGGARGLVTIGTLQELESKIIALEFGASRSLASIPPNDIAPLAMLAFDGREEGLRSKQAETSSKPQPLSPDTAAARAEVLVRTRLVNAQELEARAKAAADAQAAIAAAPPEVQAAIAAHPGYKSATTLLAAISAALAALAEAPAETTVTSHAAWRDLTPKQLEAVKARAKQKPWKAHKSDYRGRVFEFVRDTYCAWIPGLLQHHLMSDKTGLYGAFTKAVSRNGGLPDWLNVPKEDDVRLSSITDPADRNKVLIGRAHVRAAVRKHRLSLA